MVKYAQKLTGVTEVAAIIGGLHLTAGGPDLIRQTIQGLKELKPQLLVAGHYRLQGSDPAGPGLSGRLHGELCRHHGAAGSLEACRSCHPGTDEPRITRRSRL